ncbi:MAG TPA: helix-turn-helix domain-containing protein [Candidatus Limnocylindrales bacterium]|nr:helix-turn-helix domain-containing protein [Candidatus Limnocylindrales bacterium]
MSKDHAKGARRKRPRHKKPDPAASGELTMLSGLAAMTGDAAGSAIDFFLKVTGDPLKLRPLLQGPAHPGKLAREAGNYVRELRELAGLTISDLARALELRDSSYLEAVEAGAQTLSFDLVLRISAIVARNDPLPTILKLTRTSNPAVAKFLEDWGAGRLPLQIERERLFVNLLRGNDEARELTDESFEQVLVFTKGALDSAVALAAEFEHKK